jgi:exonuclease VII large subunit
MELNGFQRILSMQGFMLVDQQRRALAEIEGRCLRSGNQLLEFTRRELHTNLRRMQQASRQQLQSVRIELKRGQSVVHTLHPAQTLKRGFMLLKRGERLLTKTSETKQGEFLELEGNDGSISIQVLPTAND